MISINTISILVFIFAIIILLYKYRKKIEFQKLGNIPIVSILRTKLGINFINKTAKKNSKLLRTLGYIGMIIGYLGMIAIFTIIVFYFIKLFIQPGGPAVISPVVPGVKIPGVQIFIPFWYGIISLFIVMVIHELGHGLVAKAHKYKIKSTGLALILILPGAFVEPDEEKLAKAKVKIKNSVYAAGPWFNVLLAILAIVLVLFVFSPLTADTANYKGFTFKDLDNNSPAMKTGLPVNATYTEVNDIKVDNVNELSQELSKYEPGNVIRLKTETKGEYSINLTNHPQNENMSYIGILNLDNVKGHQSIIEKIIFDLSYLLYNLFYWVFVLSFGIGTANLLPIGPLDGGRMFHTLLKKYLKKEEIAKKISSLITKITLLMLAPLLFIPILRAII